MKRRAYPKVSVGGRRVVEHRLIAARALGRPLPSSVQVHHVDGDPTNNARGNLVICQDQAYHQLLHIRQDALDAGYPAEYRRCVVCRKYDDLGALIAYPNAPTTHYHRPCFNSYHSARDYRRRHSA